MNTKRTRPSKAAREKARTAARPRVARAGTRRPARNKPEPARTAKAKSAKKPQPAASPEIAAKLPISRKKPTTRALGTRVSLKLKREPKKPATRTATSNRKPRRARRVSPEAPVVGSSPSPTVAPVSQLPTTPVPVKPARVSAEPPSAAPLAAPSKPAALAAQIPAYLLEGDEPTLPAETITPGKYAVTPGEQPKETLSATLALLPEAYDSGALYLTARDPHWVCVQWDLAPQHQRRLNALAIDHHLIVRVSIFEHAGQPAAEVHVHPESQHWFVHVPHAGTRYVAELGYYRTDRLWASVAVSAPAETPPDAMAEDKTAEFAQMPLPASPSSTAVSVTSGPQPEARPDDLIWLGPTGGQEGAPAQPTRGEASSAPEASVAAPTIPAWEPGLPPADAFSELDMMPAATPAAGQEGMPGLSEEELAGFEEWTEAREAALLELLGIKELWREDISSAEIADLVRRLEEAVSSNAAAPVRAHLPQPAVESLSSLAAAVGGEQVTSPGAPTEQKPPAFWFNINAELVVYGATEPDARVEIGGRRIRLRLDGTFSYRFALPDGHYDLPVAAASAHSEDRRSARLRFSRQTEYHGDVGAHAQDAELKSPAPENLA